MRVLEIEGVQRSLSHLDPFIVTIPKKGRDGGDLRVRVILGLHVISRACDQGETGNLTDENGRQRMFSEERYAFSLNLRPLMTQIILEKHYCWESSDRNRKLNYAVLNAPPAERIRVTSGVHRVAYFHVYPGDSRDSSVNLFVNSCHERNINLDRIKRRFDLHYVLRKCLYEQKRMP